MEELTGIDLRFLFYEIYRLTCISVNISEECAASIFRVGLEESCAEYSSSFLLVRQRTEPYLVSGTVGTCDHI